MGMRAVKAGGADFPIPATRRHTGEFGRRGRAVAARGEFLAAAAVRR